jgi:hypothetical protein
MPAQPTINITSTEAKTVKTNPALLVPPVGKECFVKKNEPYTVRELEDAIKCYRTVYADVKARYNALRIAIKKREGIP